MSAKSNSATLDADLAKVSLFLCLPSQSEKGMAKSLSNVKYECGLGRVTLRGRSLTTLRGIRTEPEMTELFLQGNLLTDFEGMPHQPSLRILHCEDNKLCSLRGLERCSHIEEIFLQGNPLSKLDLLPLMCFMVIGKELRFVNGNCVPRNVASLASCMSKQIYDYLREGWVLVRHPDRTCKDVRAVLMSVIRGKPQFFVASVDANVSSVSELKRCDNVPIDSVWERYDSAIRRMDMVLSESVSVLEESQPF